MLSLTLDSKKEHGRQRQYPWIMIILVAKSDHDLSVTCNVVQQDLSNNCFNSSALPRTLSRRQSQFQSRRQIPGSLAAAIPAVALQTHVIFIWSTHHIMLAERSNSAQELPTVYTVCDKMVRLKPDRNVVVSRFQTVCFEPANLILSIC